MVSLYKDPEGEQIFATSAPVMSSGKSKTSVHVPDSTEKINALEQKIKELEKELSSFKVGVGLIINVAI